MGRGEILETGSGRRGGGCRSRCSVDTLSIEVPRREGCRLGRWEKIAESMKRLQGEGISCVGCGWDICA